MQKAQDGRQAGECISLVSGMQLTIALFVDLFVFDWRVSKEPVHGFLLCLSVQNLSDQTDEERTEIME